MYPKFWAQVVRTVARPPLSSEFDVQTVQTSDGKGKFIVEALTKDSAFLNFLTISGAVIGPDAKAKPVRLVQTGPGTYEGEFDATEPGAYVAQLVYQGPAGKSGMIPAGMAVNASPELRELKSNDAAIRQVADKTGGRILEPWAATAANLFSREGLMRTASPLPIWDILIPILLGLIIVDVAVRRIAWDWASTKKFAFATAERVRGFTVIRKVESRQTLDALKRVREEVAETKFKTEEEMPIPADTAMPRPDPKAKFQAKGVEGDIAKLVGGASDKPIPPPPKKVEPKGAPAGTGGHTSSLLEAKRRAQQKIREKEHPGKE